MATNLNLEGSSFTPVTAEIRLRANTSDGMPLKHDDVDSNFENLRLAHNSLVSDLDDHIGSSSSSDHPIASTASHGFMSSTHVTKLNGIATNANNYSLPTASSSTKGGIKTGYTQSGKNYPVQLTPSSQGDRAYVNVPWTDTIYSLPTASSSTRGGIKVGYSASGKNYPVRLDEQNNAYVNVPWTDTNTDTVLSSSAVKGFVATGFTMDGGKKIGFTTSDDAEIYADNSGITLDNGTNRNKLKFKNTTDNPRGASFSFATHSDHAHPLVIERDYHNAYVLTTDNADKRTLAFGDWWTYSTGSQHYDEFSLKWHPELKMAQLGNDFAQNIGAVSGAMKVLPGRRYTVGIHLDTNTNTNNVLDIAFLKTNDQLLLNSSSWLADYVGDDYGAQQDLGGGMTDAWSSTATSGPNAVLNGTVTTEWHYNLSPGSTLKYYEFDVKMDDDTQYFSVLLNINNTRAYTLYFDPSIDVTLQPEAGYGQGELDMYGITNYTGSWSDWDAAKLYYRFHKTEQLVHLNWTLDPNGGNIGLMPDGYISYQGLPFMPRLDSFINGNSQRSIGSWGTTNSGDNLNNRCYIQHFAYSSAFSNIPPYLIIENQDTISQSGTRKFYGTVTYPTSEFFIET